MIPGINLSDTVLGVDNNHLLIALKTTPIDAPGRDALTHAARRNVDDLAQAIFLNSHADFTHHARTVRNVLYRLSFAVPEEAAEQQQRCNDYATHACKHQNQ